MYDTIQDLPDIVRKGLDPSTQQMVRGILNNGVYTERLAPGIAMQRAQTILKDAGWEWDGTKWVSTIGKKMAEGVIRKVEQDHRLVFGWANVVKDVDGKVLLDRQDDFIDDTWEIEKAAYHYVLNSRDGGVMHVRRGAATMVESMVFTNEKIEKLGLPAGLIPEGWWIGFHVTDDSAWNLVKSGDFTGFSIHGKGRRTETSISEDTHTAARR